MFTETDGLVYETENDVYEEFYLKKDMFDFNKYLHNLRFYDVKNKKVTSKIKDKVKSVSIVEFVNVPMYKK